MKILLLVIFVATVAAGIYLKIKLDKSLKKIKQLQIDRNDFIKEKAKISDQVRRKGIEIDKLERELDKYKDSEIKVALTLPEKKMILNALESSQYKSKVQNPKTQRFIRIIYNTLKEKIKESIKE